MARNAATLMAVKIREKNDPLLEADRAAVEARQILAAAERDAAISKEVLRALKRCMRLIDRALAIVPSQPRVR